MKCGAVVLLQHIPTCAQDGAELWGDRHRWELCLSLWFAFPHSTSVEVQSCQYAWNL